jgi:alpha-N-arabinofuranosidase
LATVDILDLRIPIPLLLAAVSGASASNQAAPSAVFYSFEYTGQDAVFASQPTPGHFLNPILAGFYPDPDICRVGGDYYLVNSSFAYFPGIPVFHSRDLVNWQQIGNVVNRPGQLDYHGIGVSRGIFAPALSHHDGLFYLVCTFVDAGGNFLMTAKDPAGPWSDPTSLGFEGIDPSIFFDDDGRAWLVSNGVPPNNRPMYNGHRAIYLQELDSAQGKLVGPREIIVNGGARIEDHPVWIEGPHLFKKEGFYYLICAEGGTGEQHSEVVFRSRAIEGPYSPGPNNPILTQRTLPLSRLNPVTCTGHADFVETEDGRWWSVFLGCRPYRDNKFNTGRETFMLPVVWTKGWPSILPNGTVVPYSVKSPHGISRDQGNSVPYTGNFTWRDDFRGGALSSLWMGLRGLPDLSIRDGLWLSPRTDALWGNGDPAFICRRIQHASFRATTSVEAPTVEDISVGLVAFQNESHHYFLGVRRSKDGLEAFVECVDGSPARILARAKIGAASTVRLRIDGDGAACDFAYSTTSDAWNFLLTEADATILSTDVAGGFVGAVVGLHARLGPQSVKSLR